MDLSTVKENLLSDLYSNPNSLFKDLCLIFSNSCTFNTNKRSPVSKPSSALYCCLCTNNGLSCCLCTNHNPCCCVVFSVQTKACVAVSIQTYFCTNQCLCCCFCTNQGLCCCFYTKYCIITGKLSKHAKLCNVIEHTSTILSCK